MISTVAQTYGIHPQTLRLYEREGLLRPSRTEGNTRLYSEEDLRQLETILNLTRDLGVNLAGVEIILNMRDKMEKMQGEMSGFIEYVSAKWSKKKRVGKNGSRTLWSSSPREISSRRTANSRSSPLQSDRPCDFA